MHREFQICFLTQFIRLTRARSEKCMVCNIFAVCDRPPSFRSSTEINSTITDNYLARYEKLLVAAMGTNRVRRIFKQLNFKGNTPWCCCFV